MKATSSFLHMLPQRPCSDKSTFRRALPPRLSVAPAARVCRNSAPAASKVSACKPSVAFKLILASIGFASFCSISRAADPLDTWHSRISPYGTDVDWRAVAYGNGKFVAVSARGGHVITSSDGVDWQPYAVDTTKGLYGLTYANGKFVAVGASGNVFTSASGEEWEPQETDTNAHLYHLSHANGLFLAVGDGGTILSSPDGIAWTPRNTGSTNKWEAGTYGNGTYVVVGYRTQTPNIYTRTAASPTLSDWILTDSGASHYLSGVACGKGKFVAVGYGGLVQISPDGVEWSEPGLAVNDWLYHIAYANETFLAVGEDVIVSSPDGLEWTTRHTDNMVLHGAAFGNGTWVAIGNDGLILQSDPVQVTDSGPIVLKNPGSNAGDFTFSFNGEIGHTYAVQASGDLVNWTSIANVLCTTAPMPVVLPSTANSRQFLRVAKP